MIRKCLAVGIILLFVGVIIAPTVNFNTVKASTDDDLIEVTSQACGIKGYKDTTVKLTREQYQNLEQYLVKFRARLNLTSTREEAVPIFKDAVVELDKYGLLPRGMSVERAQRLVTISYDKRVKVVDSLVLDPFANYFCLVSGRTCGTLSFGPFAILAAPVFLLVAFLGFGMGVLFDYFCDRNHIVLAVLANLLSISLIPIVVWSMTRGIITTLLPFGFLSTLTFGATYYSIVRPPWSEGSSGWVNSIGLNGEKKYEGSELWGTASKIKIPVLFFSECYPGIIGFTGIRLKAKENTIFLGSAIKVKLGTELLG